MPASDSYRAIQHDGDWLQLGNCDHSDEGLLPADSGSVKGIDAEGCRPLVKAVIQTFRERFFHFTDFLSWIRSSAEGRRSPEDFAKSRGQASHAVTCLWRLPPRSPARHSRSPAGGGLPYDQGQPAVSANGNRDLKPIRSWACRLSREWECWATLDSIDRL